MKYGYEDQFMMSMLIEAISLLKQPCIIELDIPQDTFAYKIIKKGVYKYWKANGWCFKDGAEVDKLWEVLDELLTKNKHRIEVI